MLDRRRRAAVLEPFVPVRSSDPREAILDALVWTVARRGYEHATVEEVLALAAVPAPVFAEHFEGKRDCLLAALERSLARIGDAIARRTDPSARWSERVGAGLRALLGVMADHPEETSVVFVECLSAGEPAITRLRRAMANVVPALEEGRRERESDQLGLPIQTSEAIVGGIASILHRRVLEGEIAGLGALAPDLLYFALLPYLGHERALSAAEAARAR